MLRSISTFQLFAVLCCLLAVAHASESRPHKLRTVHRAGPGSKSGISLVSTEEQTVRASVQIPQIRVDEITSYASPSLGGVGYQASRVLIFQKERADTRMRFLFEDNMRVVGSGRACRWELRVDDKPCPSASIHGDIYVQNDVNPHRPRVVMGVCDGITQGSHSLKVFVGATPGFAVGDCATGWRAEVNSWTLEAEEVPAHWQAVTAPMPYSDLDVGYVPERELVFEKKQAGSRMRLWYYDNHRVLGQDTACRWSLKVNGGDCRNGMIAGDYYMVNIDNPHRMHVIMGYCDGLPAGKHKLQVYVDVSRFYKSADCFTGWGGSDGKATVTLEAEEIQDGETYAVTGYGPVDERDSGWPEKRYVQFNKAYGESSMRFTYYDNLRSLGHYKFCSWEFRVDGNRCPSGNIGGDVLSVSGENPARPRVITGYCDGISVGSHTLAILVRNDFWPGDCLTGWQTDISSWTLEAKEIMPNPVLDFIRDQAASQVAPIVAPKAAVMQDPAVKGATDAGAAAGRQASLEQQKSQAPLREARVAAVASDKGSQAGSVAAQDAATTAASNAARKQSNLNAEVVRGNVEKEVAALRDSEGRRATEAAIPVAQKVGAEAGAAAGLLKTKQIEAQRDLAVKAQVEAQANKLGGLAAAGEARKAAVAAGDAAGQTLSSDLMAKQQEAVNARLQRDKGIADGVANQAATDAAWKAGYEAAIKSTKGVFDTDNAVGDTEIREQAIKYGESQGASFGLESGRTAGSTEGKAKATQLAGVLTTDTQESLKKILADAVNIGRTAGADAADDAGEEAAKPMVDRTAASMQTALSGLEDAMSDWAKKAAAELLGKIAGEKGAEAGAKAAIDPARAAGTEAGNAAGKEVGVAQAIQDAKPLIVQAALGLKAEKEQAHEKVVGIGKNLAAEVAVKVAQDVAPNEALKAGAAAGESVAMGVGREFGTVSAKQAAASVTDVFKKLAESDVARMLESSQDEAGRIARDTAAADADKIADKVASRVASDKAKTVAQNTARNVGREAAQEEIAAQDVLLKTVASEAAAKLAPGAVEKVAKEVAQQTAIEVASKAGKDAGLKEGETIANAYADTLHDELRDEIRKLHKFNEDATIKFAKTNALKTAKVEGQLAGEKAGAEAGIELGKRIENAVLDAERADASNLVELAKLRAMGEIMAAAKGQLAKLAADRLKKGAKTVGEIAKHSAAEVAVDAAKAGHLNEKAKETGPRLSQLEDRLFALSQALHLPGSHPPVNVEDVVKQAEAEQAAAQGGDDANKVTSEQAAEKYVTDRIQQLEKMLLDFEASRYRTRERPLTPFPGAGDWSPTEGPPIIDQSAPLAPRNWPFATLTDTPKPKHVEYNRNIFTRSADGKGPSTDDSERSVVEPYTEELNDKRKQHPERGTGRIIYEGYDPNEDNSLRARRERSRKSSVTTTADEVDQLPADSDIMVPPSRQADAFKKAPAEAEQVAAGSLPKRTAPVPDWVADEYANPEMRFRQQQQQQKQQ